MSLLPVVSEELFESLYATSNTSVKHMQEILDQMEEENYLLFQLVEGTSQLTNDPRITFYYKHGLLFMYWILRKQAESDEFNEAWGGE